MGIFSKNGKSNKVPVAPPIFINHTGTKHTLLKMPSSRGLNSLHNSSPILGASFRRQHSSPTKKRRSSFSDVIASASTQQEASKPKPTIPIKRANSNHSGDESYIEEVIVDDDSYYEEVLIEEEFYEEEIIEIMNELKLPERDITIKFEDFDEMQTTLHINDYSPGEVEKSWYCRADYDRMVQKARSTIAKVEAKEAKRSKSDDKKREKDTKSSEFSQEMTPSNNGEKKKVLETRGLEGWSTEGAKKVRELKEKALEAVWNEQNRQWTTGDFDKEKVRAAYLTISAGAQAIAEERAAADQESAEKIHNKDLKRKKTDVRGMMKMGKSMLGKSMKGGLIKAKKQVSKVSHNSKRIEEIEQRQIIRQPSQGSRLLLDHLDDSQSIELSVNESQGPSNNRSDHQSSRRTPRKVNLSRTASWEGGLASGKY